MTRHALYRRLSYPWRRGAVTRRDTNGHALAGCAMLSRGRGRSISAGAACPRTSNLPAKPRSVTATVRYGHGPCDGRVDMSR